jgi:hypothetical protein
MKPRSHSIGFSTRSRAGAGRFTDYVLTAQARCPTCKHEITEKTLVELMEEQT